MKKRVTIAALCVILMLTAIGGTLAYFTTEGTATNVITSGNINIELQETAVTEDGQTIMFEDSQERFGVMPGDKVSKIVRVKNIGDNDAYVRVRITKSIELAEGVQDTPDEGLISMDFNTENWIEKDGWHYYCKPLVPGATTEPLFNNVLFDTKMGNMYQNSTAIVQVDVQATQVKNNEVTDVTMAKGWPESK